MSSERIIVNDKNLKDAKGGKNILVKGFLTEGNVIGEDSAFQWADCHSR